MIRNYWRWLTENWLKVLVFYMVMSVVSGVVWGVIDGVRDAFKAQTHAEQFGLHAAPQPVASKPVEPPPPPPKPELVYDPPCGPGSNSHACTEQITGKSRVTGRVHTVTFDGDETTNDFDHVMPEY